MDLINGVITAAGTSLTGIVVAIAIAAVVSAGLMLLALRA